MALTEIYVDPSIAADSGAGTIGDPYGDLEYAIVQSTFDTTNGTRINIKAGTAELPAAELSTSLADTSVSAAWVPSAAAPLVIQGYTSAAGDGGIGAIDQGGASKLQLSGYSYVSFIDMELYNCGAATSVVRGGSFCSYIRCNIHNATLGRGILVGGGPVIVGCYIHDIAGRMIDAGTSPAYITHNICSNAGTQTATDAIITGSNITVANNIINIDSTTNGIIVNDHCMVVNNSIYSNGGTGKGIGLVATSDGQGYIANNLVEGFSGTGGIGIDLTMVSQGAQVFGGNSVYNCATEINAPGWVHDTLGTANESLSASPFTSASTGDFSPVDTGAVKEGAVPQAFWTV